LGEYPNALVMKGRVFPIFVAFERTKNGKEMMHVFKSLRGKIRNQL
jgi:hypothetical protein